MRWHCVLQRLLLRAVASRLEQIAECFAACRLAPQRSLFALPPCSLSAGACVIEVSCSSRDDKPGNAGYRTFASRKKVSYASNFPKPTRAGENSEFAAHLKTESTMISGLCRRTKFVKDYCESFGKSEWRGGIEGLTVPSIQTGAPRHAQGTQPGRIRVLPQTFSTAPFDFLAHRTVPSSVLAGPKGALAPPSRRASLGPAICGAGQGTSPLAIRSRRNRRRRFRHHFPNIPFQEELTR